MPEDHPGASPGASAAGRRPSALEREERWLRVIAIFKLAKALILVCVGIGLWHILRRQLPEAADDVVLAAQVDPDNRFLHSLMVRFGLLDHGRLETLSLGSFFYAALFLTEGTGLMLKRRWAEYFTIISTATLIPIEVYELIQRHTWLRLALVLANVAVVIFLIVLVRRKMQAMPRAT